MFTGKYKLLLFSAILLCAFLIISCGTQPTGSPTPGKTGLPVVTTAPIWSPDGSQIAVQSIQSGKRMIMLVDLASGTVSPVTEGELIGWMVNP